MTIFAPDRDALERAEAMVEELTQEAEIGRVYLGKVKRITDFGAFVEIFPGTDGLIHISHLAEGRVEKVTDVRLRGRRGAREVHRHRSRAAASASRARKRSPTSRRSRRRRASGGDPRAREPTAPACAVSACASRASRRATICRCRARDARGGGLRPARRGRRRRSCSRPARARWSRPASRSRCPRATRRRCARAADSRCDTASCCPTRPVRSTPTTAARSQVIAVNAGARAVHDPARRSHRAARDRAGRAARSWDEVASLDATARGAGGFGHTGIETPRSAGRARRPSRCPSAKPSGRRAPSRSHPQPPTPAAAEREEAQRARDCALLLGTAAVLVPRVSLADRVGGLRLRAGRRSSSIMLLGHARVLPADRGQGRAPAVALRPGGRRGAAGGRLSRQRVSRDAADDGGAARA